jgi:hypothetical protein
MDRAKIASADIRFNIIYIMRQSGVTRRLSHRTDRWSHDIVLGENRLALCLFQPTIVFALHFQLADHRVMHAVCSVASCAAVISPHNTLGTNVTLKPAECRAHLLAVQVCSAR